jgi:hypothetical protein
MKKNPDFIIIPHQLILDENLQPLDRILYGVIYWLVHLKNEKCTASNQTLKELCGCKTNRAISKSLDNLEKFGYVERIYSDGNKNIRNEIIPLISFNSIKIGDRTNVRRDRTIIRGGDRTINEQNNKSIKEEKINNIDIVANATEPFSFESELDKLLSSKDKKLQIIGLYWKFTGIAFPSKEAFQAGLRRELRPAKNLIGYPLEQIISIFDYLDFIEKNEGWLEKWTLETVHKFIDRVNWVPRDSTLVENLKGSLEIN